MTSLISFKHRHLAKGSLPFLVLACLLRVSIAHAVNISGAALSTNAIAFENGGTPTSVDITFSLDTPADVTVDVHKVASSAEAPSEANKVTTVTKNTLSAGANSVTWNGLWLIDGDLARQNGSFKFVITATTASATAETTVGTLLSMDSVDIHSITATPSFVESGEASFPYTIRYALSKDALVSATIIDSSSQTVRTLLTDKPQVGETTALNTLLWDGTDNNGQPVPLGIYRVRLDARDATSADQATPRTRSLVVGALTNTSADAKTLFKSNVVVYPNPVRDGVAIIKYQGIRAGSSISIRIYSIAGDLVRQQIIGPVTVGNVGNFQWDLKNQSGSKVGRGLYYVVVKENDNEGTLITTKKLAVIQ